MQYDSFMNKMTIKIKTEIQHKNRMECSPTVLMNSKIIVNDFKKLLSKSFTIQNLNHITFDLAAVKKVKISPQLNQSEILNKNSPITRSACLLTVKQKSYAKY